MAGLIDFAPTADDLLAIEPEDLGMILVRLARSSRSRLPDQQHLNNFTLSGFEMALWNADSPGYQHRNRNKVARALAEAWQWLQTEGLIMADPDQPNGYFVLTRRGERLDSDAKIEAYQRRGLLPSASLHPVLLEKVRPMFLRGDYDLATFEAFRQVEIAVRAAASLAPELDSVEVMRKAFDPEGGALIDSSVVKSEQHALSHLFAGAIGHAKNPGSHRTVNLTPVEATALIWLASYLLGVVDARAARVAATPPSP
jgi:uncharacterized protein (TIGR02391 family)